MSEEARLEKLVEELVSNPGYIDGRRRFPRTLSADDAMAIIGLFHDAIDAGCEARAGAARTRKLRIVCEAGCNHCCEQPVIVYLAEAMRIAAWLAREENGAVRMAFLEAYPVWRERVGDGFDAITGAADDTQRFVAHVAQFKRRVLCAFNVDGRCAIYPVRPKVCRHAHALDTSERCKAECWNGELPAGFRYAPLDGLVDRAHAVDKAMHHALGGAKNRRQALCQAVYDLLVSAPPAAAATEPYRPRR